MDAIITPCITAFTTMSHRCPDEKLRTAIENMVLHHEFSHDLIMELLRISATTGNPACYLEVQTKELSKLGGCPIVTTTSIGGYSGRGKHKSPRHIGWCGLFMSKLLGGESLMFPKW